MASSVFLDTNILLEVLLERKKTATARLIIEANAGRACISGLTGHLVIYFTQKVIDLPLLRRFLSDYKMLELNKEDFDWAFNNMRGRDFEDALQLGVAIRSGCDRFITFDQSLAKAYKDLRSIKVELV